MRREVTDWISQAEADYKKADVLQKAEYFDGVAFYSHQASEKAMKGLYLLIKNESAKSHSLIYLANELGIPRELMTGIRELNPEYMISRYPDIANGIPAENYDEVIGEHYLTTARRVILWVKNRMEEFENSLAE
ncbi:MAG: HEPN domain-containing protein [Candidatus Lokiarchaeota archaeon]|nr:HEPN domain-containing protein [Candidatus Lokiarchaeota archaeon]